MLVDSSVEADDGRTARDVGQGQWEEGGSSGVCASKPTEPVHTASCSFPIQLLMSPCYPVSYIPRPEQIKHLNSTYTSDQRRSDSFITPVKH